MKLRIAIAPCLLWGIAKDADSVFLFMLCLVIIFKFKKK